MARANLSVGKRIAVGVAQFVQIPPLGGLDQVLRVSEQVDDGYDFDVNGAGGGPTSR